MPLWIFISPLEAELSIIFCLKIPKNGTNLDRGHGICFHTEMGVDAVTFGRSEASVPVLPPVESEAALLAAMVLRGASPLVGEVTARPAEQPGFEMEIRLNPQILRSRAEQQGILDSSPVVAAEEPRVRKAITEAVARANLALPPHAQICAHRIASY